MVYSQSVEYLIIARPVPELGCNMSLRWYMIRRSLALIPTMLAVFSINIIIIMLAPGDPAQIARGLDPGIDPQAFVVLYDLDRPVWDRFVGYLSVATMPQGLREWLDWYPELPMFGYSWSKYPQSVSSIFRYYVPRTLLLSCTTFIISLIVAFSIGGLSATRRGSMYDKFSTTFLIVGYSVPYFFLAKCVMVSSFYLTGFTGQFRSDAFDDPWLYSKYLILPSITIILGGSAFMSRYVRSLLLEVLRQDYILAARSKGLKERSIIFKHALKNVSLPLITIIMLAIPGLWTGALITETVFSYPGMGRVFFRAVTMRDYPLAIAGSIITSAFLLIFILISDIMYALVDPRIKY